MEREHGGSGSGSGIRETGSRPGKRPKVSLQAALTHRPGQGALQLREVSPLRRFRLLPCKGVQDSGCSKTSLRTRDTALMQLSVPQWQPMPPRALTASCGSMPERGTAAGKRKPPSLRGLGAFIPSPGVAALLSFTRYP